MPQSLAGVTAVILISVFQSRDSVISETAEKNQ